VASRGQTVLMLGAGLGAVGLITALSRDASASTDATFSKAPRGKQVNKEVRDPRDGYSLARVIQSEEGSKPEGVRRGVAWATRNEAYRRGVSITTLVIYAKDPTKNGKYGSQNEGRYCSTASEPTTANRALAEAVLAQPRSADPTNGSVQYDSPKAQRYLAKKKVKGYVRADGTPILPEDVARNRMKEGKRLVLIPGVPEEEFRMWSAVSGAPTVAGVHQITVRHSRLYNLVPPPGAMAA
jgi:hypothetical protein